MTIDYDGIRAQITWMCAVMIPGDGELGMPSANDVDVVSTLLPRALKARPDLAPKFHEIVSKFPSESPSNPLEVINSVPAAEMEVVGRFIAGAYFSAKEVAEALRFPGFEAIYENVDYDEIVEAIEPIMERGPCYVEVQ
jgi:hypothetical protein